MCLIVVAWRSHPRYPCIIAANRDEFHERATAPGHWWAGNPPILAGRDLQGGGTWLGFTRTGRFAALTNYRTPQPPRTEAPSRGNLVTEVLRSTRTPTEELARLQRVGAAYNGFNLIFSDGERLGVYESVRGAGRELTPGIYGLSNDALDTPWPKVQKAKLRLQAALQNMDDPRAALDLLRDERPAADAELPKTGLALERERLVSSAFIRDAVYGTRCSTVVRIDQSGQAIFDEWSWDACGEESNRVSLHFDIAHGPVSVV
jgi:uncharacterized protein with NRDE domain